MKNIKIFSFFILFFIYQPLSFAQETFSGPYIGFHGGYFNGDDHSTEFDDGVSTPNGWTIDAEPSAWLIGGYGGYNHPLKNNFLVGLEGDFEGRIGSDDVTFYKLNGVTDFQFPVVSKSNYSASLRARLGYLLNMNTLFFITGGYAAVEMERTFYDLALPGMSQSISDWHHGWTAGAGLEQLFLDRFSVKLEYRFSNYGEEDLRPAEIYSTGFFERFDYEAHTIKLGVSYQFN